MASTSKCPFCGGVVQSNEKNCPHCGGENKNYVKDTPRRIFHPKTIEELKEYCAERGMPLLRMRFFVGEDYREPKAFGIYKAGEHRYIVYKNKADGSRAIRYDGPDESFAVNELFEKLLSECHNRGIYPDGLVQRSSEKNTSQRASGQRRSTAKAFFIGIAIFLTICFINPLLGLIQQKVENNKTIASLRQNPDTYDSVYVGKKYYTFDLNTNQLVSSRDKNSHLNDGYYHGSYYVYPSEDKSYQSAKSIYTSQESSAQQGAFYYRNGEKDWYAYITSEKDWKPAEEPLYSRLGQSLDYLGSSWQESWEAPDFSSFPIESGYYSQGSEYYYREPCQWYIYKDKSKDWIRSNCPVRIGIPAEGLEYLGNKYLEVTEIGIKSFMDSTPYAVENKLSGYYRQGGKIYYLLRSRKARKNSSIAYYYTNIEYDYTWYIFGREPDSYVYADPTDYKWYKVSEPAVDSISYLGNTFEPSWQEWAVPNNKLSANNVQISQTNDFVDLLTGLFSRNKNSQNNVDSDADDQASVSDLFDDGFPEIFLSDFYQADASNEWEEDWILTDFKTTAAWQSVEEAEAAEAIKFAREVEEWRSKQEQQVSSSNSWYDSDYDDWDSDDTDWDSDW